MTKNCIAIAFSLIHPQCSIWDFLFGEKVDPESILEPRSGEKKCFRPSRGVRGHASPENFEKIVFRID